MTSCGRFRSRDRPVVFGAAGMARQPWSGFSLFDLHAFDAAFASAASVAAAGATSGVVSADQGYDRPGNHQDDDAEDDHGSGGHCAVASLRRILSPTMNGFLETSRKTSTATDMTAITMPEVSGDSPPMKLPTTYTMDATM